MAQQSSHPGTQPAPEDGHQRGEMPPLKDGSTPFGQGQKGRTVTQDEEERVSRSDAKKGPASSRPTSKRR